MRIFIFILAGLLLLPGLAFANSPNKLTPENIQAFLDESSRVTHPETGYDVDGIKSFLKDHLSSRSDFITHIIYDIEGFPPQERKFELNRASFIKNITDGVGKIKDYTSFAKLVEHDITNAGRKAEVVVVTSEKGLMPMQGEMVPFDGKSRCSQILSWERRVGVVVNSANCETILTIENDQE